MANSWKIEDDLAPEYEAWKTTPSPTTTGALLRKLQPTISRGVNMYLGKDAGPTTISQAKQLTLQALQTYDPQRARLSTHVTNHLKGLRRVSRQEQQIIHTPDRVVADQAFMQGQTNDLADRLGRQPTDVELADHTGLSLARIAKLRRHTQPLSEGLFAADDDLPSTPLRGQQQEKYLLQLVYEDLGPRDQQILEWSLGVNHKPMFDNQTIAEKLGVTPGAVSQRKAFIQQQLDQAAQLAKL